MLQFAAAATRIPWKELLKATPAIITAAEKILNRWNEPSRVQKMPDVASLAKRLDQVEKSEGEQADLVKQMAEQLKGVTEAMRVLALRVAFAVGLSAIALVVATIALWSALR